MNKEFVMRGQTASGQTEVLNFSGHTPGFAYRITEFSLYPSTGIGSAAYELVGSITAGKTAVAPTDPNFNDEGLIATAYANSNASPDGDFRAVINDTFLITQDLILMVQNAAAAGSPINWQYRFVGEKMNSNEEAVTNFKQYTISSD